MRATKHGCLIFIFLMFYSGNLQAQRLISWTDKNTCLFGYKNDSGTWVIPARYNYAGDFEYKSNTAVVGINKKYGLIDKKGNLRANIKYDAIRSGRIEEVIAGKNEKKYYYVFSQDNRWGLLDTNGKIAVPPRFENINWKAGDLIGTGPGFANINGKVLNNKIEIYNQDEPFFDKYPIAKFEKTLNTFYYADFYKDEFFKRPFERYKKLVFDEITLYGLVDTNGKIQLPARYPFISAINQWGIVVTGLNDKKGLADNTGKLVVPAIYDNILTHESEFIVKDRLNYIFRLERSSKIQLYNAKLHKMLFPGYLEDYYNGDSFVIVRHEFSGKYGLGKYDGTFVIKPEFDLMIKSNVAGQYIVKKRNTYGITDSSGKKVIPLNYSWICDLNNANRNDSGLIKYYMIGKGGLFGLADSTGNIFVAPQYDYLELVSSNFDSTVLAGIKANKAWELILKGNTYKVCPLKSKGPMILGRYQPPKYIYFWNSPKISSNDSREKRATKKSYLVDSTGQIISSGNKFMFDGSLNRECFAVHNGSKMGIFSATGKVIVPLKYKRIIGVNQYYIEKKDGYSPADSDMTVESFYYFQKLTGKLGLMDRDFKILLRENYSCISNYAGCWFVKPNKYSGWEMFSTDCKSRYQTGIDSIGVDYGDFVEVYQKGKTALLNKNGVYLTSFENQKIKPLKYHFYTVKKNSLFGLIDANAKEVLPCEYDSIGDFIDGYSEIRKKNKVGMVDSLGHLILKPIYTSFVNAPIDLSNIYIQHGAETTYSAWLAIFNKSQKRKWEENMKRDYIVPNWCHNTLKTNDNIVGIETRQYLHDKGYFELLSRYPNEKQKVMINNYLINRFKGQGRIRPIPKNYVKLDYAKTLNPKNREILVAMFGDSWEGFCQQKDYHINYICKNLIGIQSAETLYNSSSKYKEHPRIQFQYLYLYKDSIEVLNMDTLDGTYYWEDTVAVRIEKMISKKDTNSRFCNQSDLTLTQKTDLIRNIRRFIPLNGYKITKEGLKWHVEIFADTFDILITYKELAPYLPKNSPLLHLEW